MREKLIAGNWKMNKTASEAKELIKAILPLVKGSNVKVAVAPTFTALSAVSDLIKGSNIILAAQNVADQKEGAFTGETSIDMLKDVGVTMVLLGHSERRQYYGETDDIINKKVKFALENGMMVDLCVGETLSEREAGKAFNVVNSQLTKGLAGVSAEQMKNVVIAYEPVWAIGTGKTASSADAEAVHAEARKTLANLYGADVADKVIIQYGGSVNPANVKELMAMPNIDGALVGGASLKADSFSALVNFDK